MSARSIISSALVFGVLWSSGASAQEVALPETEDTGAKPALASGAEEVPVNDTARHEIDLSNVVLSAAKTVTTVQEAPSIVTVITADEIKARGFKHLSEVYSTVPGWIQSGAEGNMLDLPLVRGVGQAALSLKDGVSTFEPWSNASSVNRTEPLETIKRVELVTGPGGVLWGANSFLGILNMISKDAEDVPGHVEVSAGYGDG